MYSGDYTINHNENDDENVEKVDHIDMINVDVGLDIGIFPGSEPSLGLLKESISEGVKVQIKITFRSYSFFFFKKGNRNIKDLHEIFLNTQNYCAAGPLNPYFKIRGFLILLPPSFSKNI